MPESKMTNQDPLATCPDCVRLIPARSATVRIGNREWMVKNLDLPWPGSWAPNGDEQLTAIYGRLYTHAMALQIAAAAPHWRLPSKEDVEALVATVGGLKIGAAALKAGGSSGFEALFAGFREPEDNAFRRTGRQTGFWTATVAHGHSAWKMYLTEEDDQLRFKPVSRDYGDSIRLIRSD